MIYIYMYVIYYNIICIYLLQLILEHYRDEQQIDLIVALLCSML